MFLAVNIPGILIAMLLSARVWSKFVFNNKMTVLSGSIVVLIIIVDGCCII